MSTPARTALSVQPFLTKNGMTPVSYPPSSPPLPWATFCLFVSLDENSLQREMFCHYKGANMMFKMLLVDRLIFCYPDSETLPWDKTCCEDDSNHSCPAARGRVQSAHQRLQLLLWGRDSAGPQWTFVNWLLGSCKYHHQGLAIVSDYGALRVSSRSQRGCLAVGRKNAFLSWKLTAEILPHLITIFPKGLVA